MPDNAIQILTARMTEFAEKPAIFWRDQEYTYADLIARIDEWRVVLDEKGLKDESPIWAQKTNLVLLTLKKEKKK